MAPETIGRYEVNSELGRGGFAVVYLADDPFVKRQVAVKVLPRQFTDTEAMRVRFQQEAEIIAALEHPTIVPIYDYGEHEGQPFIVMRYMAGGSLADRIKEGEAPMSLEEAGRILNRIGSALERAHDQGIIHRDLKPGNILFDQYGDAYLSDFGIARLTEASLELTGGGAIGTPAYMSPEQVYGDRPVDGRCDIYALGVILFEMLTGAVPYKADTPAKLMMKHVLEPVPRILEVKPDLPQGCENILERAMAKEPDDRFSRATEFTSAVTLLSPTLPAAQPPAPIPTKPSSPPEPAEPPKSAEPPSEETVLETPTPPEVRRMAEPTRVAAPTPSTPEPMPSPGQETEITAPTPPSGKPGRGEKGRPSWFKPGLIAAGALAVILLLVAFVVIGSNIFGGDETAGITNDNNNTESTSTSADSDNSSSATDSPPRETADSSAVLPEAEGALNPRQVSNFQELIRLGRGFLTGLDVSPDGSLLAAGSGIGVWIYEVATMEPLTLLEGHAAPVRSVAWSPDGQFLASAGDDGLIKIWETETGQESGTLEGHDAMITSVAWSFDGRFLASGGYDNVVRIWDMENGRLTQILEGHEEAIRMVSWPPDNNDRVASAGEDGTANVWFIQTGEPNFSLEHPDLVEGVLWSADGGRLITGSDDNMVRIWDAANGEPIFEWMAHEFGLITLALSPDGRHLVTTGGDGYIRLWETDTGVGLFEWAGSEATGSPQAPAWLPDNETIALSSDNSWLGIFQVSDPQEDPLATRAHTGQIGSIAWTPQGRGIVSGHNGDDMTFLWNLDTQERAGAIPGFTGGDAKSLSISADGSLLARPSVGIEVFDLSTGFSGDIEPFLSEVGDAYVQAASLSPDAGQVAAVDFDSFLRVWNLSDQNLVVEVSGAGPEAMAWSPDGRLIATPGSDEAVIIIWDSQTGEQLEVFPFGSIAHINGLDWSPDGRFLAAVDTDGLLYVWERESWGLSLTFQSRGTSLNSLDWSPDGRWLAAGSWSGSIYVWDATGEGGNTPALYVDLAHLAPVVAIAWSPDSTMLASGSHDGTVRVWGIGN